jgi:hypothetical protein
MKEIMQLSADLEEKYDFASKENLKKMIENVCMRCFKIKSTGNLGEMKKYKDEIFMNNMKIKHLYHYVCGECKKEKTK